MLRLPSVFWQMLGEFVGTFVLVFVVVMVNCSAIFANTQSGQWQIAVAEGLGVTLAIYVSAALSEAHLNPAVTLAIVLFRRSSNTWTRVLLYPPAQLLGALTAASVAYAFWNPAIEYFEAQSAVVRGQSGSELSASAFACYYPNPGVTIWQNTQQQLSSSSSSSSITIVSTTNAFFCEFVGTMLLMLVIMALTDRRNRKFVSQRTAPLLVGLTVAVLISMFASHSQAGFNPARDFGPRLLAYMAGWGSIAIPAPHNGFWIYLVAPLLGAPTGALLYSLLFFYPHHILVHE